jgi:7-carboxy-7-deazaguanine synthase
MAHDTGARNICFTGGEPVLQQQKDLDRLIVMLHSQGFEIEMFSNGTLQYSEVTLKGVHIVMDWKLPGSGEDPDNEQRLKNYLAMADAWQHTIKFTCLDDDDLVTAYAIYHAHAMESFKGTIYAGPVWDQKLEPAEIVKFILEHQLPWRLNLQIHKYIWDPNARRT